MYFHIRALTPDDEPTLWVMLTHAAHEPSLEAVQNQPTFARYVRQWGRPGDMGGVANTGAIAIGAAWLRLWSEGDRGFGYIDAAIPELAMAVLPQYQGQGVGTALLSQVLDMAQSIYPAVSLSARADNPAVRLYHRAGFTKVEGSDTVNRTGGVSFTMVRQFS